MLSLPSRRVCVGEEPVGRDLHGALDREEDQENLGLWRRDYDEAQSCGAPDCNKQ